MRSTNRALIATAGGLLLARVLLVGCGDGGADGPTGPHDASVGVDASPTLDGAGITDARALVTNPTYLPFPNAITADELAVIVNRDDPNSVALGAYYQTKRHLPAANVISVSIPMGSASITSAQFATIEAAVNAAVPANIQAYALAFTQPYAVVCESITSAFALGFDMKWCGGVCDATALSPYYGKEDIQPSTHLHVRPTMMLVQAQSDAGVNADAFSLVDRGIASDDTHPKGTDYLIITNDKARNVQGSEFEALKGEWDPATGVAINFVDNAEAGVFEQNFVSNKTDILGYFLGAAFVAFLPTDTFIPGALAVHLTSNGGQVPTSVQMSAAEWIAAGATASYGTVAEPCNFTQKFPDPSVAVPRYYRGSTAVEAMWKSVPWPGQGLFVGEPLASPWKSPIVSFESGTFTIKTTALVPNVSYRLEGSDSTNGPFTIVQTGISVKRTDIATIVVNPVNYLYYRLSTDADAGH